MYNCLYTHIWTIRNEAMISSERTHIREVDWWKKKGKWYIIYIVIYKERVFLSVYVFIYNTSYI